MHAHLCPEALSTSRRSRDVCLRHTFGYVGFVRRVQNKVDHQPPVCLCNEAAHIDSHQIEELELGLKKKSWYQSIPINNHRLDGDSLVVHQTNVYDRESYYTQLPPWETPGPFV